MTNKGFRQPTEAELLILKTLLQAAFPGRDELNTLLKDCDVKTIDNNGSLAIQTRGNVIAPVLKRIPVEAEAKDEDEVVVHILLHVVGGKPVELEIFKEDGSQVQRTPLSSALESVVLAPVPPSRDNSIN